MYFDSTSICVAPSLENSIRNDSQCSESTVSTIRSRIVSLTLCFTPLQSLYTAASLTTAPGSMCVATVVACSNDIDVVVSEYL